MTVPEPKPVILMLNIGSALQQSLTTSVFVDLLAKLGDRADVKRATTAEQAETLMDQHLNPRGILIADAGITKEENDAIAQTVTQFVRRGGTAVLGGVFSRRIRPTDFNQYFEKAWSLLWEYGSFHRTSVLVTESALRLHDSGLLTSCTNKAVNVKNAPPEAAWYLFREDDAVVESLVFVGDPIEYKIEEAPVVFSQVGEGWLGYTGVVNGEVGTTRAVLGMFGLL